jgi:hypothetical protein
MNIFKRPIWLILFFLTLQAQASSFEATLTWPDSSSESGIAGKAFFVIDDNFVTAFQIVLQDPIGEAPSLQPIFQLPDGSVPFTLMAGRHFTANDFSWDYDPLIGYNPGDPFAPTPINPISATSYRFHFDGPPGLESELLSQGGTFQITINGTGDPNLDNTIISGPLLFVPAPEPNSLMLLTMGFILIIVSKKFIIARRQI